MACDKTWDSLWVAGSCATWSLPLSEVLSIEPGTLPNSLISALHYWEHFNLLPNSPSVHQRSCWLLLKKLTELILIIANEAASLNYSVKSHDHCLSGHMQAKNLKVPGCTTFLRPCTQMCTCCVTSPQLLPRSLFLYLAWVTFIHLVYCSWPTWLIYFEFSPHRYKFVKILKAINSLLYVSMHVSIFEKVCRKDLYW